mmetsp:Transcript_21936/g.67366  ORF Transcript_21936/g.67366 Transcript_21936/m.67366 type:complete len:214 (-) Transcript_21936:773-1414(-)
MYVEASKYVLLGDNAYAHAQTLLCGTLVLVAVFGRARGMSLFVFHPIFMNFMVMFMTEGLIVYRNTFAYNALHSIMQFDAKTKYRNLHTGMQVVATAFGALGALFIAANKIQNGKSIMPMSIHSILGTLALVGIITQVLVGFRKRHMIRLNEEMGVAVGPTYRWHGKLGLVTYDLCALSMLTGMLSYLPYTLPNLLVMVSRIICHGVEPEPKP